MLLNRYCHHMGFPTQLAVHAASGYVLIQGWTGYVAAHQEVADSADVQRDKNLPAHQEEVLPLAGHTPSSVHVLCSLSSYLSIQDTSVFHKYYDIAGFPNTVQLSSTSPQAIALSTNVGNEGKSR
jgi:hypothetical protein